MKYVLMLRTLPGADCSAAAWHLPGKYKVVNLIQTVLKKEKKELFQIVGHKDFLLCFT